MSKATGITAPMAYARFAGLSYLAIFVLAIYANFTIFGPLIEAGDPAASAENIRNNETLFRLGVACFVVVLIFDLLVAWSLYLLMRPVNANLSLLSAIFHLVYTTAHVGVVLNLASALEFVASPEAYAALEAAQRHAIGYHFLVGHQTGFTVTLIFFGLHLILLGYLVVKSKFLPGLIGVLVAIAGAGYLIDGFGKLLFEGFGDDANLTMMIVVLPALVGEGALTLWLLIRGVNRRKWMDAAA